MITLTQLRAFEAVARHRHFTRAAEDLGIAQPSVSYQVRELERSLRVTLVDVVGRRVFLTDAGERLAERAGALLNELDAVERELRDYGAGLAGRVRIGATRTVGGYALPGVLTAYAAAHAGVELRVTIDNTQTIEELLLERELDLAIVEWQVASADLMVHPLRRDRLVLIAPPNHPLAQRGAIQTSELEGERFIVREPGSGTRALVESALGPVAARLNVVLELDEPEAIVRSVQAGLGLSFISETIVAGRLSGGMIAMIKLDNLALDRDFSLVQVRDRPLGAAARAFVEMITQQWTAAK